MLRRPEQDWPLLLAANRDEMTSRPWLPPGYHWSKQQGVVAGKDCLAGGSWLGLNEHGVVAAVMNRRGTLGPQAGMSSRGNLVLQALAYGSAALAAAALADLNPASYQSFNLVVADRNAAYWISHHSVVNPVAIEVHSIPTGLSMLTSRDLNDMRSPRIRAYLPRFLKLPSPDPEAGDGWSEWISLLASRSFNPQDGAEGAMTVVTDHGFGTVSSSLLALPAGHRNDLQAIWLFAPGRPDETIYQQVLINKT